MKKYVLIIIVIALGIYIIKWNYDFENPQSTKVYTDVEEAIKELPFNIKLPTYLPHSSTPKKATLRMYNEEVRMIELDYLDTENFGVFTLVISPNIDSDTIDYSEYEAIQLRNSQQAFYHKKNHYLYWLDSTTNYWIRGKKLELNQIIMIMESLE